MPTVSDVAKYILEARGETSALKLQKLLYYAQAWTLAWDDAPLFKEKIEAWANGPVIPALYQKHKGRFSLKPSDIVGDSSKITKSQQANIDNVLSYYGDKTPQWLSDLTHMEAPWLETRAEANLKDGERGNAVIPLERMQNYYANL
jgi:uncharacterized phage-associated protein